MEIVSRFALFAIATIARINMNLPNKLTVLRMGLTVLFLFFLFAQSAICKILALLTFSIAALTDFFDGYLAKKHDIVTDFGRIMDPIADKVLTISAFLAFVELKLIPAWMAVIIIFREVIVTSMRLLALQKKEVIEATLGGKHKTVSQMAAIFAILIFIIFKKIGESLSFWTPGFEDYFTKSISALMTVTIALTVISGISFFIRNKKIVWPDER